MGADPPPLARLSLASPFSSPQLRLRESACPTSHHSLHPSGAPPSSPPHTAPHAPARPRGGSGSGGGFPGKWNGRPAARVLQSPHRAPPQPPAQQWHVLAPPRSSRHSSSPSAWQARAVPQTGISLLRGGPSHPPYFSRLAPAVAFLGEAKRGQQFHNLWAQRAVKHAKVSENINPNVCDLHQYVSQVVNHMWMRDYRHPCGVKVVCVVPDS